MTDTHAYRGDPVENPPSPFPRLTLRRKRRCRYPIPRHGMVLACLWQVCPPPEVNRPVVYAVDLTGQGCRRFRIIGQDPIRAETIFDLLVRNTVTPFGLGDVLEELSEEDLYTDDP